MGKGKISNNCLQFEGDIVIMAINNRNCASGEVGLGMNIGKMKVKLSTFGKTSPRPKNVKGVVSKIRYISTKLYNWAQHRERDRYTYST